MKIKPDRLYMKYKKARKNIKHDKVRVMNVFVFVKYKTHRYLLWVQFPERKNGFLSNLVNKQ